MPEPTATHFGEVLRAWFLRNEWPQLVAEQVSRAKGSKIGPWASQMSNAMQGKLEPKPNFFIALGWFNQVVTERDFEGITDRRLIDRLLNGQPLTFENGQPYTAVDFFALYIGDLGVPGVEEAPKIQEPQLTQEMLDTWAEGLKLTFREACKALMSPPGETWRVIAKRMETDYGITGEDLEWTQEVIAGIIETTLKQAVNMRRKHGNTQPLLNCILQVIKENGGDLDHIKKLLSFMDLVPVPAPLKKLDGMEAYERLA